jgi:hypothetical protein
MDLSADAFADHHEPGVLQFETNAALWRLEVDRHSFRLRENQAMGLDDAAVGPRRKKT